MEQLLLTKAEAAKALSISIDTLDRLTKKGKIRRVTVGTSVRYSPDELRAFVRKEGKLC